MYTQVLDQKAIMKPIFFNFDNPLTSAQAILNATNQDNEDAVISHLFGQNALRDFVRSRMFLHPDLNDGIHPYHNIIMRKNSLNLGNLASDRHIMALATTPASQYIDHTVINNLVSNANIFHDNLLDAAGTF